MIPTATPTTSAANSRALLGVPNLDEMMGGGPPLGYSLLVSGPSGSGKSILATAFLAEGARQVETGVVDEGHRLKATRVVIDSLCSFELAVAPTFPDDFRESMSRPVKAMAGAGVTMLMASEFEDRYSDLHFSPYSTAFMTGAIIVQRNIEVDSCLSRVIAVAEVRTSAPSDELREFHTEDDGIRIGQMLADQEGLLGSRPTRKTVAGLTRSGPERGLL